MFSATKSQDHYIMFHIVKDGCYWLSPLKPADRTYFLFQFSVLSAYAKPRGQRHSDLALLALPV